MALAGLGREAHAQATGREVADLAMLGHVALVVRVAGECERRVGQSEDVAAVAGAVAADHVGAHAHGEHGKARPYLLDLHAEGAARLVLSPHRLCARLGDPDCVTRHAPLPVNFAGRFSRNARMPSAASGEAPARRCRSRSRSSCWESVLVDESAIARLVRPSPYVAAAA